MSGLVDCTLETAAHSPASAQSCIVCVCMCEREGGGECYIWNNTSGGKLTIACLRLAWAVSELLLYRYTDKPADTQN